MRGRVLRGVLGALILLAMAGLPGCEARLRGDGAGALAVQGQQALGVAGWSIVAAGGAGVALAVESRREAARRERRLVKSPDWARSLRPGSWMAGGLVRLRLGGSGPGEGSQKASATHRICPKTHH